MIIKKIEFLRILYAKSTIYINVNNSQVTSGTPTGPINEKTGYVEIHNVNENPYGFYVDDVKVIFEHKGKRACTVFL